MISLRRMYALSSALVLTAALLISVNLFSSAYVLQMKFIVLIYIIITTDSYLYSAVRVFTTFRTISFWMCYNSVILL